MDKVEPLIEEINKITNNEYKFMLKSATLDEAADFCVIEIFYKDGIILEKEIKEKQKIRYEILKEFSSKFGPYNVTYTGDKATKEAARINHMIDRLFNLSNIYNNRFWW